MRRSEVGVQVGEQFFELDFEAFELKNVAKIDEHRAEQLDFVLVQAPDAWKEMLKDIKENGRATHDYTLNSLDLRLNGGVRTREGLHGVTFSTASTRPPRTTSTFPRRWRPRSRTDIHGSARV